jgi:hypothetical protein
MVGHTVLGLSTSLKPKAKGYALLVPVRSSVQKVATWMYRKKSTWGKSIMSFWPGNSQKTGKRLLGWVCHGKEALEGSQWRGKKRKET